MIASKLLHQTLRNENYLRQWYHMMVEDNVPTFEMYKSNRYNINYVVRKEHLFKCSCFIGWKKSPCKHSVYTMIETNNLQVPHGFYPQTIEARRKRGRPRKTLPALIRD